MTKSMGFDTSEKIANKANWCEINLQNFNFFTKFSTMY